MVLKDSLIETAVYYFVACAAGVVGTFAAIAGWIALSNSKVVDNIKTRFENEEN